MSPFESKKIPAEYLDSGILIFTVVFDPGAHLNNLRLEDRFRDWVPPDHYLHFPKDVIAFLETNGSFVAPGRPGSKVEYWSNFHLMALPKDRYGNLQYTCRGEDYIQLIRYAWDASPPSFDPEKESLAIEQLRPVLNHLRIWILEWEDPNSDYPNEVFGFGMDFKSLERFLKD